MKKFKCPVSMKCTKKQGKYLASELRKLGYVFTSSTAEVWYDGYCNCITNANAYAFTGGIGFHNIDHYEHYDLGDYNPTLFLALAAMVDDEELHKGEYCIYLNENHSSGFKKNNLYRSNVNSWSDIKAFELPDGSCDGWSGYSQGIVCNKIHFRKATKEEIINWFSKKEEMKKLPKNWHVVVTEDNVGELSKWRFGDSSTSKLRIDYIVGFVNNKKEHNPGNCIKGEGYDFGVEISFETFKRFFPSKPSINNIIASGKWYVIGGKDLVKFVKDYDKTVPSNLTLSLIGDKENGYYYCNNREDGSLNMSYSSNLVNNPKRNNFVLITVKDLENYYLKSKYVSGIDLSGARQFLTEGWYKINSNSIQMNKKIIGYKPKNKDCEIASGRILGDGGPFHISSDCYKMFSKLGVIDLWFDPIYEEEKIEIGGYNAEIKDTSVKFGCKTICKGDLITLNSVFKFMKKHDLSYNDTHLYYNNCNSNICIDKQFEQLCKHFNIV